jgi:IMP cyclohydrolase
MENNKSTARKKTVNDQNVTVIPQKQKESEKVVIALDCIEDIDK